MKHCWLLVICACSNATAFFAPAFSQAQKPPALSQLSFRAASSALQATLQDRRSASSVLVDEEELGPGTIVCGGLLDADDECVAEDDSAEAPFRAKLLYWTKSELEEDRELNFLVNVSFLLLVLGSVLSLTTGPTLEAARGWTPAEVLLRLPQVGAFDILYYSYRLRVRPV
jgi:hypothetical protein